MQPNAFSRLVLVFAFLSFVASAAGQSVAPLRSSAGHDAERASTTRDAFTPGTEIYASFKANLQRAQEDRRGEAWLLISADSDRAPKTRITIRLPLSSTEDAYGESRACTVDKAGIRHLVFTAGLDEANFVPFRTSQKEHDFHFLLNKYLCRVLAAPFNCGDQEIALSKDWSHWRVARRASVQLSSDALAQFHVSPVFITSSDRIFDYAKCSVVAPSNGLCCVQHKTTEWHCGGKPTGDGWHQVSGDCYHRETGGTCSDN